MREGLAAAARRFPGRDLRIAAQQRLERLLREPRLRHGVDALPEDGIPHVDMLRAPDPWPFPPNRARIAARS